MKLSETITPKGITPDKPTPLQAAVLKHYSEEALWWLNDIVKHYTIDDDGTVNTQVSVILDRSDYSEFPVKFGKIDGDFKCRHMANLKKLNGPSYVKGAFDLEGCYSLRSLENGPEYVGSFIDLTSCESLKNLKGGPKKVDGSYILDYCENLTSLEGIADEITSRASVGWLSMRYCSNLTKIDFIPRKVGPTKIIIGSTPIKNLLILLKIPKLTKVDIDENGKLIEILQKYLKEPIVHKRDMLGCQDELIEAGFEEFAEVD